MICGVALAMGIWVGLMDQKRKKKKQKEFPHLEISKLMLGLSSLFFLGFVLGDWVFVY